MAMTRGEPVHAIRTRDRNGGEKWWLSGTKHAERGRKDTARSEGMPVRLLANSESCRGNGVEHIRGINVAEPVSAIIAGQYTWTTTRLVLRLSPSLSHGKRKHCIWGCLRAFDTLHHTRPERVSTGKQQPSREKLALKCRRHRRRHRHHRFRQQLHQEAGGGGKKGDQLTRVPRK